MVFLGKLVNALYRLYCRIYGFLLLFILFSLVVELVGPTLRSISLDGYGFRRRVFLSSLG